MLKAGGIVVATMPLLRAKELTTIIDCAEISHAICDHSLADEMHLVKSVVFTIGLLLRQFSLGGINGQ